MRIKVVRFTFLFCLVLLVLASCRKGNRGTDEVTYDLPQMKDSGELVVLTLYSSTSYFIYRGQEMGFQYELSEQFAKSLGLKLRIEVARNVPDLVRKLRNGEGDMIAYNLPITKALKDSVTYCGEEVVTHQVIVQRTGGKGKVLTDVTQLVGKEVYVKPGKYFDRLTNLNKELGGGIKIRKVEADSITVEDLITQVYQGKIDYTVCDNDLARLNTTYYPNLDIRLPISFDQRASWAVRKECPLLAEAANKWHKENLTSPAYNASMKRYFEISKSIIHSPILSLREGKISHFDKLFKKYSFEAGFNTPKHRVKVSFGNEKLFENFGFNISGRWNNEYLWQSTMVDGVIPSATVVDAQINYNLPKLKSTLKIGAANLGGKEYAQVLGAGLIGQQYFASWTINP